MPTDIALDGQWQGDKIRNAVVLLVESKISLISNSSALTQRHSYTNILSVLELQL
jgi:hypothetical protein